MARLSLDDEIAAVRGICRALGLGDVAPTSLKAAHRTTMLVASLGLVACVQSSEPAEPAWESATRELDAARHLALRAAPAVAPLDARLAGPHRSDRAIITLWPHVADARIADETDAPFAATTLADVHRALADYSAVLPAFTRTLDRCWEMLTVGLRPDALSADDRALLAARYRALRSEIEAAPVRRTPLHGDAHLGNLLTGPAGPLWVDFEDACIGPREFDIACLPPDAWPSFEAADQALVARCAELKSVCVVVWCSADRSRSPAMREAVDHHLGLIRRSIA